MKLCYINIMNINISRESETKRSGLIDFRISKGSLYCTSNNNLHI